MSALFLMKPEVLPGNMRFDRDWLWSHKLDGVRCVWDGGYARATGECIFGTAAKNPTGLYTNYMNPLYAPEWFLRDLPLRVPLDGELWCGQGKFQQTISAVRKHVPLDSEWEAVRFMVFDSPPLRALFAPRKIALPHCKMLITPVVWERALKFNYMRVPTPFLPLPERLDLPEGRFWRYVEQLPLVPGDLPLLLREVLRQGHEGIVLRAKGSAWWPHRSWDLLKLKPRLDAEATVIGWVSGAETDKGSRWLGAMGSLVVRDAKGREFKIHGFNAVERQLDDQEWALEHPGETMYEEAGGWPVEFPLGTQVTYMYRELTDAGIPKEATYYRKREIE